MNTTTASTTTPDYATLKTRQQSIWAAGHYEHVGTRIQIVGELLCEAVDLRSSDRVLDVAAGNGNASLAAARRYAAVTATDYMPALLEHAQLRAAADDLPLVTQVADAEDLPYADGSFDVVLSTFGVMFAPNQERVASELARVVRPGGRIGLANWTPEGFIGELFRIIGQVVPPPPGLRPASAWGTETRLVELFGPHATDIKVNRRHFQFRFLSAEHWIEIFRTYYGPVLKAFAALDEAEQRRLHEALLKLLTKWNVGGVHSVVVPREYLEVVILRA